MVPRDNTAKLAKALWVSECCDLAPGEFQAKFDALYAASEGIATLWHLGIAANHYLLAHPNSIAVPAELAPTLLASRLVEGRVTGLKLLNRCSSDQRLISSWICRALGAKKEQELYGGLFELSQFLDRRPTLTDILVQDLVSRLDPLRSSRDPYVREKAEYFIEWLGESGGRGGVALNAVNPFS